MKTKVQFFALFMAENSAKISASVQTCGQVRKTGLFNPGSREEPAHLLYHENARFREKIKNRRLDCTSDF
jgi:hypothetical protein